MNLTHFFLLSLERSMISNKHGIDIFYKAFKEAAEDEDHLDYTKFHNSLIILAQSLYGDNEAMEENYNPFVEMFTNMLMDNK